MLVTRPEHDAQRFARALAARGAEAVIAPTIAIHPPDDAGALSHAAQNLSEYAWIVFLSRNAVDALFRALSDSGLDARAVRARVAAIGTKTADHLEAHGVCPELVSRRSTSEDVARDVLERTREGDRVLVLGAQEGRDVVRTVLAQSGRCPLAIAAYKTTTVDDPSFSKKVARCDMLAFTSGSTVRGFATLLGGNAAARTAARGKIVACIGPITAHEARDIGLQVDVVPDDFTVEALTAALEARAAIA